MHTSFDPQNFLQSKRMASRMTDEEFFDFCSENELYRIERETDGTVTMEPPVGVEGDYFKNEVYYAIRNWNDGQETFPGMAIGSNTRFVLPNGATRSPDAAWISFKRLEGCSREKMTKFLPLCPEFVVEIRSASEPLIKLQAKMVEWVENGALMAWLIDPDEKQALVFLKNGETVQVSSLEEKLSGEEVLPGFVFDLRSLKFPFF